MYKKMISGVLIAMLLALCLAGCSENEDDKAFEEAATEIGEIMISANDGGTLEYSYSVDKKKKMATYSMKMEFEYYDYLFYLDTPAGKETWEELSASFEETFDAIGEMFELYDLPNYDYAYEIYAKNVTSETGYSIIYRIDTKNGVTESLMDTIESTP